MAMDFIRIQAQFTDTESCNTIWQWEDYNKGRRSLQPAAELNAELHRQ